MCLESLPKISCSRRARCWKKANFDGLINDLLLSELCDQEMLGSHQCSSSLSNTYNDVLLSLVDKYVPMVTIRPSKKSVPWFTPDLREAIRGRRRAEKLWRITRCQVHRAEFVRHRNAVKILTLTLRRSFYDSYVDRHSHSPRDLWAAMNSLLCRKRDRIFVLL